MSKIFKASTAFLLIVSAFLIMLMLQGFTPDAYKQIDQIVDLAEQLNIRNLVTVVYLGPRIFDTMLEVLVVVLTVVGIKMIKEKQ